MRPRLLIAYSMSSTHVGTTLDYLMMLKEHLGCDTDFVHVSHDAYMDFDIEDYDIVFNSYCARHSMIGYVSSSFSDALRSFSGLKIISVQDEYEQTDRVKKAINDLGFNVVLTCIPQSSVELVYPRSEFPTVEFMTVLTGYVSDTLVEQKRKPKRLADRSIYIGYRGRDIGGRYGRLGFEKFEIGRRMKEECEKRGIPTDIAMDEASRIYGAAWYDFIEDCRAMLGSESGSNVFDFDGSIEAKYKALTWQNNGVPPSYDEFTPYIAEHESKLDMGQISPRVFECAVLRTPLILFRGRYSDIIQPDTHYIPLEKDFSNVDEVLCRLEDTAALEEMSERTYQHIVGSGNYTYEALCLQLRQTINAWMEKPANDRRGRSNEPVKIQRSTEASCQVLAEQPTALPRLPSEFRKKQLRLARTLGMALIANLVRPGRIPGLAAATAAALANGSLTIAASWRRFPPWLKYRISVFVDSALERRRGRVN